MASHDCHFLTTVFDEHNFEPKAFAAIIDQYERLEFAKGDYLIKEGNTASYYYFVESGFARSYAIDLLGNDITTNFYGPKDMVIDWHSYFLKTKSREDVQAISNCVVWKITFVNFMKLFHIEAFRDVGRTKLVNDYFALKNHSVSMITDPAKDRYLQLVNSKPDIVQNVPLKQIASYLGITDTSLSRIRKELTQTK